MHEYIDADVRLELDFMFNTWLSVYCEQPLGLCSSHYAQSCIVTVKFHNYCALSHNRCLRHIMLFEHVMSTMLQLLSVLL